MRAKKDKNKYLILYDGEHLPVSISQKKLDNALEKFDKKLDSLIDFFQTLYDDDYELYQFFKEVLCDYSYNAGLDDGTVGLLRDWKYCVSEAKDTLSVQDESIKPVVDSRMMEDLGFVKKPWESIWEKEVKETCEVSVFDQVFEDSGTLYRRRCTIEWEPVEGGRQSKSVKYRKLPVSKEILLAYSNSEE